MLRAGGRGGGPPLMSPLPAEPEAYLRGDPADRRAAAHGEGSDPRLVLQPAPEGETHQPLQRGPHAAQPGEASQLQPPSGTRARGWGTKLCHLLAPQQAPCVKHNLPGCPQCLEQRQGDLAQYKHPCTWHSTNTLADRLSHAWSTVTQGQLPGNCGFMWGIQAHTHTNMAKQSYHRM